MKLILGGPGCGKTTHLLSIVEQELLSGVQPNEIAFVAFTRKAAHEAKSRAMEKFEFSDEDTPYFRTLHSLAFRELGLGPTEVMGREDYKNIGDALKLDFGAVDEETGIPVSDKKGGQIAYLEQLSRMTLTPLKKICEQFSMQPYFEVKLYADTLTAYKRSRQVYDFTDMIELFILQGTSPRCPVVIVDEAQDLSPLQWRMVRLLTGQAERVYVAGDDDQAIYEWSGADVHTFLNLRGEQYVLPISHRLPQVVFDKAHEILRRISRRFTKQWSPAGPGGKVDIHARMEYVDLSAGSWYVLARNRYMLPDMLDVLRSGGYPYFYNGKASTDNGTVKAIMSWEALRKGEPKSAAECKALISKLRPGAISSTAKKQLDKEKPYYFQDIPGLLIPRNEDWMTALRVSPREREYYRAIRRRGESLLASPRITVATIHQVKGGEADHVLLKPDMSYACWNTLVRNPDAEHRVFYVGATRAKKSLHLLYPRSNKFYGI